MRCLLEVCVDSIASALAARQGGADRLEVCGTLASGGATPSLGFARQCVNIGLPVMMMIRPHDGGFVYQEDDIETMLADIEFARSIGVHGVVFGALAEDGKVHREHCQRLLQAAGTLQTTFHRAFDITADPLESLDQIVALGFTRLLTSGQSATAAEGVALLRQLTDRAAGRIVVMAGAGVSPDNARMIAQAGAVGELHASASVHSPPPQIQSDLFALRRRVTSAEQVRAIRQSLQ